MILNHEMRELDYFRGKASVGRKAKELIIIEPTWYLTHTFFSPHNRFEMYYYPTSQMVG